MIDYSSFPRDEVLCIDMKSFYASIEAVARGLDPMKCHLVVVGDKNRPGSVVLAASPAMKKKYGIKTTNRLYEVPDYDEIIVVNARMQHYLNVSMEITKILNEFAPIEAIHTYSVDESWVTLEPQGTVRLFGTPWETAERIRKKIYYSLGLPSCYGLGNSKLLSKCILDLRGKKEGIAQCYYEDIPDKLWPHLVQDMWGIGKKTALKLNMMGIRTIGQLAKYPVEKLRKKFGIMGEQLYYHANGVDLSLHDTQKSSNQVPKGISSGITLLKDYPDLSQIKIVVLEQTEEVARRAREARLAGRTISLGIAYSKFEIGGGGFSRSHSIDQPTNITMEIYQVCLKLLEKYYVPGSAVRHVHVSLTNLSDDSVIQLDLFNYEKKEKQRALGKVMDDIREKYGSKALLRAVSYTSGGTAVYRSDQVGGHQA